VKKYCAILLILLSSSVYGQQKLNTFRVVDSLSKKPIAFATVSLIRSKLSISTESDGIFNIPGDLKLLRDTVLISAQGYGEYKNLLHKMDGLDSIKLVTARISTSNIILKGKKELVLNPFKAGEVNHFAGITTASTPFDFLELAQKFTLSASGAKLVRVKLKRLAFVGISYSDIISYKGLDFAKFRLRFYATDSLMGSPGKELINKIVEVEDRDNQEITIDLVKYNILIPGKSFFVSVEWIRNFVNQGFSKTLDNKSGLDKQIINFRPAIGVSAVKGPRLNIWGLDVKKQWKPFTHFSPDLTDLAITAIVVQ
jgi:hypothetical protein